MHSSPLHACPSHAFPDPPVLSPAFLDPALFERASSHLLDPPGFPLDAEDAEEMAYQHDAEGMNTLDVECEDPTLVSPDRLAQLAENMKELSMEPPEEEEEMAQDPLPMPPPSQQQTGQGHSVEVMPHLEVPPILSTQGLGILTLVDFPGQPKILVCLQCRFSFSITKKRSIEAHRCPGSKELVETREEEEVDTEDDERMEEDEEEEDPKRAPSPTLLNSTLVSDYLSHRMETLATARSLAPTGPIPAIAFFPIEQGFHCPVSTCHVAHATAKTVQHHIYHHHADIQPRPQPVAGPVQTLRRVSKPTHFKVLPPEVPPARISVRQQVLDALLESEGAGTTDADVLGPQFIDTFYKTFPYHTLFPDNPKERTEFVQKRIVPLSPLYNENQPFSNQFLAVGCLLYMLQGSQVLFETDNTVQRHFGNKLK